MFIKLRTSDHIDLITYFKVQSSISSKTQLHFKPTALNFFPAKFSPLFLGFHFITLRV